jgi:hypothetical protein
VDAQLTKNVRYFYILGGYFREKSEQNSVKYIGSEKNMAKTKKQIKMEKLKRELRLLIDEDNEIEVEKVDRYLNLVSIFYDLDKSIKDKGVMVETVNANQTFLKENPAVTAKTKVNASLLKLDVFFDKKREEYEAKMAKSNEIDEEDFT